jgi:hypothetical protein
MGYKGHMFHVKQITNKRENKMNNKKYNPADFKDVDFITVGDGPVRIQFARPKNLTVGDYFYFSKKLFEMECELNLVKTLAEEDKEKKA